MYNVSNEYRAKIHGDVYKTRMTFEIDGTTYTDDNVLQGSLTITNQCTDTKDVKVGAVYVGQLNATFRNVNIARNLWRGKQITVTSYLQIDEDEDTWEAVPVGVYTVSEAQWKASGVVVKAFDNMAKFDKPLSLNQSGGLLYDFLVVASSECDVDLAQTEQEIKALPNGTQFFSYFNANDVETWRDLISYIAQIFGGFATIDRTGKLVFRTYTQTAVDTLTTHDRHTDGVFSDYVTKYTAVSYIAIEAKEMRRYAAEVDDGVTMALGGNPFLQVRTQAATALPNILAAVEQIRYTPFAVKSAANAAYDLGDVLTCSGGIAGTTQTCCVQKITLQHHKAFRIQGFGADPTTAAAKSKTDKNIAGLSSSTAAGEIGFYEYRNVMPFIIGDNVRRRVMSLRCVSTAETRVQIHVNICLEAQTLEGFDKMNVVATYMIDAEEQDLHPTETYIDGKHVLHLMYILPMQQDSISMFVLYLTPQDGILIIDRGALWAFASGAGIVGDDEWDGIFDLIEEAVDFAIPDSIIVKTASEAISINAQVPVGATLSDNAVVLTMPETAYTEQLDERVRIVNHEDEAPRITEDGEDVRITEDGDTRFTEKEHS